MILGLSQFVGKKGQSSRQFNKLTAFVVMANCYNILNSDIITLRILTKMWKLEQNCDNCVDT